MMNDRPIDNSNLQAALDEVRTVMERYGFAGAVMLVAPEEAAFTYKMDTTWSALRKDDTLPLGFRFRAKSTEDGPETAQKRVEAGMHIICQLCDFGTQTTTWMNQLKDTLRKAGVDFEHIPFGGRPLPKLGFR